MDTPELIELVTSAYRERAPDGTIRTAPAWHDLEPADRIRATELARRQRQLEAALDPQGLSTTARAILARLGR